jgi:hypothetical protein
VPQSEKVRLRLQALDERLARLRMEKNRLIARVIGGAVLAAIDHKGVPPLRSIVELLNWLDGRLTRPHDRAVFDLVPHGATRGGSQP